MGRELTTDDLVHCLRGDLEALQIILDSPLPRVKQLWEEMPAQTIDREAVKRVLMAWHRKEAPDRLVRIWAWFMRFGELAGLKTLLSRDFETVREGEIINALSRLHELGEPIDGEISDAEFAELIQSLS